MVREMIKTSPAGDDTMIIKDIKALLNNADSDKLLAEVLREHYSSELDVDGAKCGDIRLIKMPDGGRSIISKYNMDNLKYFDTQHKVMFDYDFVGNKVIDIEEGLPSGLAGGSETERLQGQLNEYLLGHYNELSYGLVVADEGVEDLKVVIVGEKLNDANYYNGKWVSVYSYNKSRGEVSGIIKIKIHYYEDGNVVMNSINKEDVGRVGSASELISAIAGFENKYELLMLKKINTLNEAKFKNLRRLMPISRSKIQWGRAIGNYKIGQDAAGGRA